MCIQVKKFQTKFKVKSEKHFEEINIWSIEHQNGRKYFGKLNVQLFFSSYLWLWVFINAYKVCDEMGIACFASNFSRVKTNIRKRTKEMHALKYECFRFGIHWNYTAIARMMPQLSSMVFHLFKNFNRTHTCCIIVWKSTMKIRNTVIRDMNKSIPICISQIRQFKWF